MKDEKKEAFDLGTEIGFRVGVKFAVEQLQDSFTMKAMLSKVWLRFYSDPSIINERIKELTSQHESLFLFNNMEWLKQKSNTEELPPLPLHELIKQDQLEKEKNKI